MAVVSSYATGTGLSPQSLIYPKRELPIQTVSWSKKQSDDWQEANMLFFLTAWREDSSRRRNKLINYRLINGEFNFNEYSNDSISALINYDINSLGELPTKPIHYPICTIPLQQLWGEDSQRPFNFRVKGEDSQNYNEYLRTKTDLLHQYVNQEIQTKIQQQLQQQKIDPNSQQGQEQTKAMQPKEIETFMRRNYSTTVENSANVILKKYLKELQVPEKFAKGWKDVTVVAEEHYWIGTVNNKPAFECVNPVNITYDKSYDIDYLDEAEWVVRGEYMAISQVIDRYRDYLTEDQMKNIEQLKIYDTNNSMSSAGSSFVDYGNFLYYPDSTGTNNSDSTRYPLMPNDPLTEYNNSGYVSPSGMSRSKFKQHALVIHSEWMSKRRIGELTFIDEEGQPQKTFVDGEFELPKEYIAKGWEIRYFWINEAWEGTQIGDTIITKFQPKANQHKSINKLYGAKLGYCGMLYNNRNAAPQSILDQMKPHQALYNIVANKLKKDYESEIGQLLLFDLRQIPSQNGWDFNKWWYYVKEEKVAFLDQFAEGKQSSFNQFQLLQTTLAQSMQAKMEFLNYLEQKCWQMSGFSMQRLGETQERQTATAANLAVEKSYAQTEHWFRAHNNLKARVLTNLLEEIKFNITSEDQEETYFLDDMSLAFIKTDGKAFTYADMSVYVSDSSKDQEALQYAKQMLQPALQNGSGLAGAFSLVTEDSIAVIKEKLQEIDDLNNQFKQQEQQLKQQEIVSKEKMHTDELDRIDRNLELDRENKIQIAEIDAEASAANKAGADLDNSGVPDFLETGKLALEQSKLAYENTQHQKEIQDNRVARDHEANLKEKELKHKEKEIQAKKDQEKEKTKQVEKQNTSQEKMQDKDLRMREKEMKSKEKIEAIKAKVAKVKATQAKKKATKK